MNRFIVHDEFGGALRTFYLKSDAMIFIRNKRGCTLTEISLFEVLGECEVVR
jgi:hypothetical protein